MKLFGYLLLMVALVVLSSCGARNHNWEAAPVLYTKYNIHTQNKVARDGSHRYTAHYTGWVGLGGNRYMVPAGAQVKMIPGRKIIMVEELSDNKKIKFYFHVSRMGMSAEEFIAQITSSTKPSFKALSAADRKGMKAGIVSVGMTKEGVLATYGLPARHVTASTDMKQWTYWKNKYSKTIIYFDDSAKVTRIR